MREQVTESTNLPRVRFSKAGKTVPVPPSGAHSFPAASFAMPLWHGLLITLLYTSAPCHAQEPPGKLRLAIPCNFSH